MPQITEINQKSDAFMEAVNKFVAHPRGFFLIAGKNGNGKSFTARAIFDHFQSMIHPHQFWNMAQLNMHWLNTYNEYGDTSYILKEIMKAPLLVLDDLGTRKPSDAFMDFLYVIADQRYEYRDQKATIITTNLNSQSMRELMGDAFTSRVASGICVRWDGPDRRGEEF
jgi:DNA replication protein DnaC